MNWGILGTGKIARKFAAGLERLPDARLLAVGSRAQDTADAFAEAFDVPRPYDSYEALVDDADVDVVYVGTPHVFHRTHALLALRHGKAVLCEKPFTLNADEAEEVVAEARRLGLFVMEAMWTRFIPVIGRLRSLLSDGAIGDVRLLAADFGFRGDFGPEHRLFNPRLGGGALLDVGVYPVSLASMVWGEPVQIASLAHLGQTGVDEQAACLLGYEGGRQAVLYTAVNVDTPVEAVLMGREGSIRVHHRFHHAGRMTITRGGDEEVIELPVEGNGLHYQAAEVMRCLREGRTESPIMPLDESVAVMRTLDRLRAQWGLRYPAEAGTVR